MSNALDEIIDERIKKIDYLRTQVFTKTRETSELLTEMNDRIIELRYFQEKKIQQDDENRESLQPVNKQTNKQVVI